jgi:hypothetical protein
MLQFCYFMSFQTVKLINLTCKCLLTAQFLDRTKSGASVLSTSQRYRACMCVWQMKIEPSPICPVSWLPFRGSEKCSLTVCNINVSSLIWEKERLPDTSSPVWSRKMKSFRVSPDTSRMRPFVSLVCIYLVVSETNVSCHLSKVKTLGLLCVVLVITNDMLQLCRYMKQHCFVLTVCKLSNLQRYFCVIFVQQPRIYFMIQQQRMSSSCCIVFTTLHQFHILQCSPVFHSRLTRCAKREVLKGYWSCMWGIRT